LDLKHNTFSTLPVHDVLSADYAPLRYIAQVDEEGYLESLRTNLISDPQKLVLTYDVLLQRTPFAARMKTILKSLEQAYHSPVDVEFTLHIEEDKDSQPQLCITILQCRPQGHLIQTEVEKPPANLSRELLVFATDFMVPQGRINAVDWVIYVHPKTYFSLSTATERAALARAVGKLNQVLHPRSFICVGPGRWGSSNSDLGVPINYGDIYHAKALVELAGENCGLPPEPSLGTHFFQDLLESQIYPLALPMDDPATEFNQDFFEKTTNHLKEWLPEEQGFEDYLRLIWVEDVKPGFTMRVLMNEEIGKVVAFLVKKEPGT
jgi:hypothetical protein